MGQLPVQGATFRSDAGPGSVKRERQPGFGGMDAREAEGEDEGWQNVTCDLYGHRLKGEERQPAASGEDQPR
ncbi:MAG: hypothetical protein ACR2J4_10745 [Deinococcus sp.]